MHDEGPPSATGTTAEIGMTGRSEHGPAVGAEPAGTAGINDMQDVLGGIQGGDEFERVRNHGGPLGHVRDRDRDVSRGTAGREIAEAFHGPAIEPAGNDRTGHEAGCFPVQLVLQVF